jgi:SIR2-like domain
MLTPDILESLRPHLFSGHYNLLLGSGVSLDSKDTKATPLKSASDLTLELCKLKDVPDSTSLSRVSLLLESGDVDKYITKPYSNCRGGATVKKLTSFVWRTVFTLNVDDALESAYETTSHAKQKIESLNYDTLYKTPTNKSTLPVVHLHGFTREPEKGYVFSTTEYGKVTRGMNPWMHVLSELMASEPFIIAGTTLNEPDLDYYLSSRTAASAANNRGPSLFIEPFPNKITENLCARHGLILVCAKLVDFLAWLITAIGNPPSVSQLTVPSLHGIFKRQPHPEAQISFFTCFELVRAATQNPDGEVSPFYYGKSARWSDLESSLDVPTADEQRFSAKAMNAASTPGSHVKILCLIAEPGSGKTTQLRRAAYGLAKQGQLVFSLNSKETIDPENVIHILSLIDKPVTLLIDGIADHASVIRNIVSALKPRQAITILAADRDYRRDHVDRLLGDLDIEWLTLSQWEVAVYGQLLERLRKAGLLGESEAVHNPAKFAARLLNDPVAIATCRALNNFRPLESILKSLWADASVDAQMSFAIASLAEHCYSGGVNYPVLEAAYPHNQLANQLRIDCSLPLVYADDGDFVLPLNAIVGERTLYMLASGNQPFLLKIFCALANALAPYVNRRTSIARTPEARLVARLFSSEHVARPLLGDLAGDFYVATREAWQWNSRYWEQRAIFTQAISIDTAIQYARHAVAIEDHPFPWTTLASLLVKKMETTEIGNQALFGEIYELLTKVFRSETERSWRPTPHPYAILFHAIIAYSKNNGNVPPRKRDWVIEKIQHCERAFSRDVKLIELGEQTRQRLMAPMAGST